MLSVRGSVMRRGGTFTDPASGISIGTDQWVRVRCTRCREESMTPAEVLDDVGAAQGPDGTYWAACLPCVLAGIDGGHRHRHRGRGRHG